MNPCDMSQTLCWIHIAELVVIESIKINYICISNTFSYGKN